MAINNKKMLSPFAPAKAVYLYNILGSLCNAALYMVMLMVVTRIEGETEGGIFAIGYAIASLTWSIGSFEMASFQATDIKGTFEFGHYLGLKSVLCLIMFAVSAVVVFIRGGTTYEMAVILMLCVYKMLDAFSGVFYSQFQRYGRLDISGKSLCCRVLFSLICFTAMLMFRRGLIAAIAAACFCELLWIAGYEMRLMYPIYGIRPLFDWKKLWKIAMECVPLFVSSFLVIFLTNLPKYILDKYHAIELQTAFAALFMPASVINLLSLFVFRPSLTTLSSIWAAGDRERFVHRMTAFITVIVGLTVSAMVFAWFAGTQVIGLIYSVELRAYRVALVIIMLGGGFSAMTTFMNYILVIMRRQRFVLIGNLFSVSISLIICVPLVKNGTMTGAAVLYAASMLMTAVPVFCVVARFISSKRQNDVN